jgi:SulP family sulfate permease
MKLERFIPATKWIREYDRDALKGDMVAGFTTAVMLIPQGMAYAMLAGLPPIVGLYASTVPLILYAFLGTSRRLAVGPVAMVSLLTAAGVGAIADGGTAAYVGYAVLLALMVGVMQLGMGLVRAGFLTNFLSHPVLSGFTSAAALIIGFSQLKHLLGIDLERSKHIHTIIIQAFEQIGSIQPITFLIGAASVAVLLALKKWKPMFPRALAVVVLGTLAVWALGLDSAASVAIVKDVPAGLPGLTMPAFSWDAVMQLLPTAITISLVAFMESIAVAKRIAAKYGQEDEIDANQELIGLGAANIGAAFFGGYPVTGGFSRTAVNEQAGARTGFAGVITALVIGATLMLLTPLFYFLPKAVLAAIIMTAVFGLIDVKEVKHLYEVKKGDLAILAITFIATLSLGIEEGILIGVGASLLWFIVRSTRPHYAVIGRLPGTTHYRNLERYPDALVSPHILAIRIDSQYYFGNVSFLKETLRDEEAKMDTQLRAVVIDATSINQLDSSADAALHQIVNDYRDRGVEVYFAGTKGPVRDVMHRSGLWDKVGPKNFKRSVHEAVELAKEHAADWEHDDPANVEASRRDDPEREIEPDMLDESGFPAHPSEQPTY